MSYQDNLYSSFLFVLAFWQGLLAVMGERSEPSWTRQREGLLRSASHPKSNYYSWPQERPISVWINQWNCALRSSVLALSTIRWVERNSVSASNYKTYTIKHQISTCSCLNGVVEAFLVKFCFYKVQFGVQNLRIGIISPNEIMNASRSVCVTAQAVRTHGPSMIAYST